MSALSILFVAASLFVTLYAAGKTTVSIDGTNFKINGELTYPKASNDYVKGLLLNSRMIQGIFDDANQSTVHNWDYPDTKKWDAARNTHEFVGNMSLWNSYGLLSFTVGLQGIYIHKYIFPSLYITHKHINIYIQKVVDQVKDIQIHNHGLSQHMILKQEH